MLRVQPWSLRLEKTILKSTTVPEMTQSPHREPRAPVVGQGHGGPVAGNGRHHTAAGRRPTSWRFVGATWAVLGFALGVTFWHAVGFLGFLEDLVSPRSALATVIERNIGDATQKSGPQNCTTMTLDRTTGRTSARPCLAILHGRRDLSSVSGAQPVLRTAARLDRVSGD